MTFWRSIRSYWRRQVVFSPKRSRCDAPVMRFHRLAGLLPAAFALHEIEEWNILAWYRQHYGDVPEPTERAVRVGLLAYVLIGLLWTVVALRVRSRRAAAFALLPLALFLLTNAFQHVYWAAHLAAYDPGLVTALTSSCAGRRPPRAGSAEGLDVGEAEGFGGEPAGRFSPADRGRAAFPGHQNVSWCLLAESSVGLSAEGGL
jgi:hypothetical protein